MDTNRRIITFPEVEIGSLQSWYKNEPIENSLKKKSFYDPKNDKILLTSQGRPLDVKVDGKYKYISPSYPHGLLGTIANAYSSHIPLKLRPDDLWLGIVFSLGNYIKDHSEELRDFFVDHQGRKEIVVKVASPFLEKNIRRLE